MSFIFMIIIGLISLFFGYLLIRKRRKIEELESIHVQLLEKIEELDLYIDEIKEKAALLGDQNNDLEWLIYEYHNQELISKGLEPL